MVRKEEEEGPCMIALYDSDSFALQKLVGPFQNKTEAIEYALGDDYLTFNYQYRVVPFVKKTILPENMDKSKLSWRQNIANDMLEVVDKLLAREASCDYAIRAVKAMLAWMEQQNGKTQENKGS